MSAPGQLDTFFRYFASAAPLTQIPRLDVLFGRRNLSQNASCSRVVLAWSEEDERYESASTQVAPTAGDEAGTVLWMRVAPVELHLWAGALTADGIINGSAEETEHYAALEHMQRVVCQALYTPAIWTRYRAEPQRLRKPDRSGQQSVLGMRGILTVNLRLPVQDRPNLLVTPTALNTTGTYSTD